MKIEMYFECYQTDEATIPTRRWLKELPLCSETMLKPRLPVAVRESRELLFLHERNYWRSLTFLKILFAIWKST